MKLEIRPDVVNPKDKVVYVWLEPVCGGVAVVASLNKYDSCPWQIVKISEDGTLGRYSSVGSELDLVLDDKDRIKVVDL
jgi:hypothetical protein